MPKTEDLLKELAKKTMLEINNENMPTFFENYHIFMKEIKILEGIETEGVEPQIFPYEMETTFLREDDPHQIISREEALKNAQNISDYQIKVPKVVG